MSDSFHAVGVAGLLRPEPLVDPHALQRAQQDALADAYAQGVQDGEAAMLAAYSSRRQEAETLHAMALGAAEAAQQSQTEAVADCLADLAIAIARAVLAAEPHVRRETVQSLVCEALKAAPANASGTIFVAAEALEAAEAAIPPGWILAADPHMPHGTARATLDASAFTASMERRLAHLAALLTEDAST